MPKHDTDTSLPQPIMALAPDQFATLMESFQKTASSSASPELTKILEVMQAMVEANTANTTQIRDQVDRSVMRSNADHEHLSVFTYKNGCPHCASGTRHPDDPGVFGSGKLGHPPVPLTSAEAVYWPYGCRVWPDQCTILELELLNQFKPGTSYYARDRQWKATWSDDKRQLQIDAPVYFVDNRNSLPALPQVLTELLYGQEAADPTNALAVIADLQKRLTELETKKEVRA